jgi:hypothetical protein
MNFTMSGMQHVENLQVVVDPASGTVSAFTFDARYITPSGTRTQSFSGGGVPMSYYGLSDDYLRFEARVDGETACSYVTAIARTGESAYDPSLTGPWGCTGPGGSAWVRVELRSHEP